MKKEIITVMNEFKMKKEIITVMNEFQNLNDNGFGVCWFNTPISEREKTFKQDRLDLFKSEKEICETIKWLEKADIKPIAISHYEASSYRLKHMVEHDIGYITNGCFILAAFIYNRYLWKSSGRPNVIFAMSKKCLNRISLEQRDTKRFIRAYA